MPKDDPVICPSSVCKWQGRLHECKRVFYKSDPQSWRVLAGREGYHYHCPKCHFIVKRDYWAMS